MQILYGDDLLGDGTNILYGNAAAVNMASVTSVRVTLVFNTLDNNVATTAQQQYWMNGAAVTVAAAANPNRRIFRAFSRTITLRN